MKKIGLSVVFFFFLINSASAQCAMCKATLENNISNGNIGIAAGINFGILYLFVAPYLAIATLAYFWYRTSKRNESKLDKSSMAR
jgi:hypothetical protein